MSRPASLASRLVHAGYVLGSSVGCCHRCRPPDYLPIGIYITDMSEGRQEFGIGALHPIRSFREVVKDQLLVLRFPPFGFCVRVKDRLDMVLNVLCMSDLVM